MNRRRFLGALLGLATAAALPIKVEEFLATTTRLSDESFIAAVNSDEAIIALLKLRIATATKEFNRQFNERLYNEGTQT